MLLIIYLFKKNICRFQIFILKNEKKVFNLPVDYEPSAVAVTSDASFVAVGGALDNKVNILRNLELFYGL